MSFLKKMIMKNIALLFICVCCALGYANGQITISNVVFPKAGDTLQTSTDFTVSNIKILKNGINQTWDFRGLNASAVDKVLVKAASSGSAAAQFPNAELVEQRGTLEYYINVTNNRYEEIGTSGASALFFNINAVTKINPANIARRAPMAFLDLNNTTSAVLVAIPLSALPDSLKAAFGPLGAAIDSIRVNFSATRTDLVDGYGTVKLPIGDYEVLREKRIAYSKTDLEAYLKLTKSWLNITTLLPVNQLPPMVSRFLGKDTTTTYNFFDATHKEPIAVATMDNANETQAVEVTYKNFKKPVATNDESEKQLVSSRPDIIAMPNPAVDIVNFELTNLQQGTYTLRIYNLLGSVVWEEKHNLAGAKTIRLDTNSFKKGTYLYSLSDSRGKIIATKRLIVLKA